MPVDNTVDLGEAAPERRDRTIHAQGYAQCRIRFLPAIEPERPGCHTACRPLVTVEWWPPRCQPPPMPAWRCWRKAATRARSEEHKSELQSLMRSSYAVF